MVKRRGGEEEVGGKEEGEGEVVKRREGERGVVGGIE